MSTNNSDNGPYKYFFETDRILSFKKWPFPDDCPCSLQKIAEAGFHKSGNDEDLDSVSCFFCQKELDGWEVDDDPWEQHAKHSPKCMFVEFGKPEIKLTKDQIVTLSVQLAKCRLKETFEKKVKKEESKFNESIKEILTVSGNSNIRRPKKK